MDNSFVLQIRNYQRIKSAKLEFVPGLNVIQGQSNNGKTAIFRAIQTAVFNLSRESHVTLGETKSAVGIRYRGHEVIWRRDNNAPSPMSYRVDGKILTKLGRGQPKIISDLLGIREVELDEMKIKLNFQKQMEYPFLLDKTPSQLFKFIVQSAEEDNVMDVIQTMKTDLNTINVNVKAYEEARESLRIAAAREIKRYKDKKVVVPYCDRVLDLEGKVKKYHKLKELIVSIKTDLVSVVDCTEQLSKVSTIYDKVDNSVKVLETSFNKSVQMSEQVEEIKRVKQRLDEEGSLLDSLDELVKKYQGIDDLSSKVELLDKKKVLFGKLQEFVNSLVEVQNEFTQIIQKRESLDSEYEVLESMLERINQALEFYRETSEKIESLQSLISEIQSSEDESRDYKEQMKKVSVEMDDIIKEIDEYDICPFCGSDLGGEHGEH